MAMLQQAKHKIDCESLHVQDAVDFRATQLLINTDNDESKFGKGEDLVTGDDT